MNACCGCVNKKITKKFVVGWLILKKLDPVNLTKKKHPSSKDIMCILSVTYRKDETSEKTRWRTVFYSQSKVTQQIILQKGI